MSSTLKDSREEGSSRPKVTVSKGVGDTTPSTPPLVPVNWDLKEVVTPLTVKFSPPALAGESQSAIKPLTGWENVKESKFVPLPQDVELGGPFRCR